LTPKHKQPASSGDRDVDITGQSYIQWRCCNVFLVSYHCVFLRSKFFCSVFVKKAYFG